MNENDEQVLIVDAQIFTFKDTAEPRSNENRSEQAAVVNRSTETAATVEKKDYSAVFARLKKSARSKSAGIL